jgi:hypothetical protein
MLVLINLGPLYILNKRLVSATIQVVHTFSRNQLFVYDHQYPAYWQN